ncbi:hypothetical protein [Hymenobacter rubidus]|uniref:hypothetical protein n=1 Tax=Hymenobacter rubidus TaxID=1441626 RepID=UPI00192012B3|nr:hypothetical protein [Hymenobacter rubidus]
MRLHLLLLLLLALPLHAAAQMNGSSYGNSQLQAAQRQAQMSNDFQRQVMERQLSRMSSQASRAQLEQWAAQREQKIAKQHEAEQKATDDLARFAQRQDSLRRAHPSPNAQQAAARQQEDAQQLAVLTVRTYRDVFLPGQMLAAEQARTLSPKATQNWQAIDKDLLDNGWWSQQNPAQLLEKITAHRTALNALTTELLGFDPATAPKPERTPALSPLDAMRAKGPFDPQVATQFMVEAARVEKVAKSPGLVSAINEFNRRVSEAAARPEYQQNPQKLRSIVKSGLNAINKEMERYELEMYQSGVLNYAQTTLRNYAATYLPKNDKAARKRAS